MKIAIITGASSGLGREFIKTIYSNVCDIEEIWLIARRAERLSKIVSEFEEKPETHGKAVLRSVPMDIADIGNIRALDNLLKNSGAEIKLLVNNAGCGVIGDVSDMPAEGQLNMIDVNNKGLTAVTSVALRYMKRGSGIINVCSIASFAPNPRMTVYCSTKAYVLSFSKSLRFELKGKGINVLAVCPGPMRTEFLSVAGIEKGTSKAFDTLPYTEPEKVAGGAVKALLKGRGIYTPGRVF